MSPHRYPYSNGDPDEGFEERGAWFRNETGEREGRTFANGGGFAKERTAGYNYTKIYLDTYGTPDFCPCGANFNVVQYVVHHIDFDHWNHTPSNLVALCRACHARIHHTGRVDSKETKEKRNNSQKEFWDNLTPEDKAERLEKSLGSVPSLKGIKKHEDFGKLQSNAQYTSRMRYCECGLETNAGAMARHTEKTGHNASRSKH